jgi:hypothetical protein
VPLAQEAVKNPILRHGPTLNPVLTADRGVPHTPGFPVGFLVINELHAAFLKVVHRRCRPAGHETGVQPIPGCPILRAFCEGWDTTNLDTDGRVSHPLQKKSAKDGAPAFSWCFLLPNTKPRLNRELVSSQKPHEVRRFHRAPQEIRGYGAPRVHLLGENSREGFFASVRLTCRSR